MDLSHFPAFLREPPSSSLHFSALGVLKARWALSFFCKPTPWGPGVCPGGEGGSPQGSSPSALAAPTPVSPQEVRWGLCLEPGAVALVTCLTYIWEGCLPIDLLLQVRGSRHAVCGLGTELVYSLPILK